MLGKSIVFREDRRQARRNSGLILGSYRAKLLDISRNSKLLPSRVNNIYLIYIKNIFII